MKYTDVRSWKILQWFDLDLPYPYSSPNNDHQSKKIS